MPHRATRTPQPATTKCIVRALLAWFAASARDLPWRRTRDPYAIWVSEIMLQQTQVATVIPYWERWMCALPTIESVAKARPARLRKLWEGLGYYTRVRNLQKAARQIVKQQQGPFPVDFETILALPGIGRYTAGAIASIAFNQPNPILDGNVRRVLTRLFAIRSNPGDGKTSTRLWQLAEELVREASFHPFHVLLETATALRNHPAQSSVSSLMTGSCSALNQCLMELGAVICTPRNPRCGDCPVAGLCAARQLGIASQLPRTGKRVRTESRHIAAFLVKRRGRILAQQRPADSVNARFWELPQVEVRGSRPDVARLARERLGIEPLTSTPLCAVNHSITRYRLRVEVFAGNSVRPLPRARWLTRAELQKQAFTGLDRKILRRLHCA